MAISVETLRARFPEVFASTDATVLGSAIDEASRRINRTLLGSRADDAHLYLAAHLAVCSSAAIAGAASSVTAGRVSVTYGSGGSRARSGFLELYEQLIESAIPGVAVAR